MNMNTNGNLIRKSVLPYLCALIALITLAASAEAAVLHVGPTRKYKTPCQAIAAAAAGDTIYIDYSPSNAPGVGYYDDTCSWTTNNLTLIGVPDSKGNRPVLNAAGLTDTPKTGHLALRDAIWVPRGKNTAIRNLEFENAYLDNKDGANGAGIKQVGLNLTVLNCYFHNNQDGILEGNVRGSHIVIKNSEFYQNGVSDKKLNIGYGLTHNLYIGNCASLLFEYNYTHGANVGHLLKSRAAVNYILYNRITGENGTDSYEIDLPNGGTSYVIGNVIEQGPRTENPAILSYMEEGTNSNNPGRHLYVVNNTFVNQATGGTFVVAYSPAAPVLLENNIFYGPGTITNQSNAVKRANFSVSNDPSMFVDFKDYNYNLSSAAGSPPVDSGTTPGSSSEGYSLKPTYQYVQHTGVNGYVECEQPRTIVKTIDIGAYEYGGGGAVTCPPGM